MPPNWGQNWGQSRISADNSTAPSRENSGGTDRNRTCDTRFRNSLPARSLPFTGGRQWRMIPISTETDVRARFSLSVRVVVRIVVIFSPSASFAPWPDILQGGRSHRRASMASPPGPQENAPSLCASCGSGTRVSLSLLCPWQPHCGRQHPHTYQTAGAEGRGRVTAWES